MGTLNGLILQGGRYSLDIRRNFLTSVAKHWNNLHREIVQFLLLEVFKSMLAERLCGIVYNRDSPGLNRQLEEVASCGFFYTCFFTSLSKSSNQN